MILARRGRPAEWRRLDSLIVSLCLGAKRLSLTEDLGFALLDRARAHGLGGVVATGLVNGAHEVPGTVLARADALRRGTLARHLMFVHEASCSSDALSSAGIPHAVVKGPVLAELHHREPSARAYVDLDVLVCPQDLEASVRALEGLGCHMEARNWRLLTTALPSELQMSTASGAILDLHWHLMVERHLRLLRRIDTGELIGRYRDVVIGGSILPTIDATDTLIHLCVHGADSGGDRLLWLFDVHSAVCSEPPDWPEVVERAARYRVRGQVALMLRRSLRVFGTSVPGPVLDQLGQNGWSSVDVIAGVLAPIGAAYPRGSLGRSIARATRERPRHGARELLRRGAAWSWAGGPWGPDPSVLVPGSVNPGSALFDSGGSLEDYLQAVRVEGESRGGSWHAVPNRASGD